jgi:hypothetical protein
VTAMERLTAGKTEPLKVASTAAVRALMQRRVREGTVERPDVGEPSAFSPQVKVKVLVPEPPKPCSGR